MTIFVVTPRESSFRNYVARESMNRPSERFIKVSSPIALIGQSIKNKDCIVCVDIHKMQQNTFNEIKTELLIRSYRYPQAYADVVELFGSPENEKRGKSNVK